MTYNYDAALFAERNRNRVYDIVVKAVVANAKAKGMKRKEIADKIGRKQSHVTKLLSGPGNWTLDTISDLLFAVDAELDYEVVPFSKRAKSNVFHPMKSPPVPSLPLAATKIYGSASHFLIPVGVGS